MTTDPFAAMAASLTPKRAVSYLRVSTREQAQRGGAAAGSSIPAQREANKKKAMALGALIVKEFVDRGESARSANRPELQKMLHYLQDAGDIDYVIVHKLDRLARNRADDVDINRILDQTGTRLISTTEYAARYRINPATANKAVALLVDEGLVVKRRGIGMFVADGALAGLRRSRRAAYADGVLHPALDAGFALGLSSAELRDAVVQYLNAHARKEPQ